MSEKALLRYLEDESGIACLWLDRHWTILKTNRFTRTLLGQDLVGKPFRDILVGFAADFDPKAALSGNRRYPLSLDSPGGLPHTLSFRFLQAGRGILAVGEVDASDMGTMREALVAANHELSVQARRLAKANAELVRLGAAAAEPSRPGRSDGEASQGETAPEGPDHGARHTKETP